MSTRATEVDLAIAEGLLQDPYIAEAMAALNEAARLASDAAHTQSRLVREAHRLARQAGIDPALLAKLRRLDKLVTEVNDALRQRGHGEGA